MHLKISDGISSFIPVRYDFSVEVAYDFILEQNIDSLPVDPFKICKNNNWKVEKASDIAKDLKCSVEYLLENTLHTKDGIVIYSPETNKYSIIYNDLITSPERIRWTITHEIGHIALNHLSPSKTSLMRNELKEYDYRRCEKEADCFAGVLLAPPIILSKLNKTKDYQIKEICELSYTASKSRADYINTLYDFTKFDSYSECIINQFEKFLGIKYCLQCGNSFYSKYAKYCPVCGNIKIIWDSLKGVFTVKYDSIDVNNKFKACTCPVCENENTDGDGGFCQICGTYIKNECTNTNCGSELLGGDRFCTYCGSMSTFYSNNLLQDWETVKSNIEFLNDIIEPSNIQSAKQDFEPVYDDDDGMPF